MLPFVPHGERLLATGSSVEHSSAATSLSPNADRAAVQPRVYRAQLPSIVRLAGRLASPEVEEASGSRVVAELCRVVDGV